MIWRNVLGTTGNGGRWRDMSGQEREVFLEGFWAGVWLFAWWKNGEQFCGSTGTRLSEVKQMMDRVREELQQMEMEIDPTDPHGTQRR